MQNSEKLGHFSHTAPCMQGLNSPTMVHFIFFTFLVLVFNHYVYLNIPDDICYGFVLRGLGVIYLCRLVTLVMALDPAHQASW